MERTEQKAAAGNQTGVEEKVARMLHRVRRLQSVAETRAAAARDPTFIDDLNASIRALRNSTNYVNIMQWYELGSG